MKSDLDGVDHVIPIAADESVQGLNEVEALAGRFDVVNIKLDKCGGLTEGLSLANVPEPGMKVMVGNMIGTSWRWRPPLSSASNATWSISMARSSSPTTRARV